MKLIQKQNLRSIFVAFSTILLSWQPSWALKNPKTCEGVFLDRAPFLQMGFAVSKNKDVSLQLAHPEHAAAVFVNTAMKALNLPLEISRLSQLVKTLTADQRPISYWEKLADAAGLKANVPDHMEENVPHHGPVIFALNHVTFGWEGVAFLAWVSRIRPDVKILLTELLRPLPGLTDHSFLINVYGKSNNSNIRQAMSEYLQDGHAIVIFPAGAISVKQKLSDYYSSDPRWRRGIVDLMEAVPDVQIVPVAVDDEPGTAFHLAKRTGPLADIFGALAMVRGLSRNTDSTIPMFVGESISKKDVDHLDQEEKLNYIRSRLEAMLDRTHRKPAMEAIRDHVEDSPYDGEVEKAKQRVLQPIPPAGRFLPIQLELFKSEKVRVIHDSRPDSPGEGYLFLLAQGQDIPHTLREIGRQRNFAYRPTGEGNPLGLDIDRFDKNYLQIIMISKANLIDYRNMAWSSPSVDLMDDKPLIIGGYRAAVVSDVLRLDGVHGLYTYELVEHSSFINELKNQSVELGRSYINESFRGGDSLQNLWTAIMKLILIEDRENGRKITHFFGPVSLPGSYTETTKHILYEFRKTHRTSDLAEMVSPRTPLAFSSSISNEQMETLTQMLLNKKAFNSIVRDTEKDPKSQLPPLFTLYDMLGAKDIAVNFDPDFNSVDWMIVVDISKADPRILARVLGSKKVATDVKALYE